MGTLKKLKHIQKGKQDKQSDQDQFAEQYLKALPEIAHSSSLTDIQLLDGLSSLTENIPENGDEIKERLGLFPLENEKKKKKKRLGFFPKKKKKKKKKKS